jgi:glycerol-1-phosphate dehydrogenase [NAD(P)+]
MPVLTRLIPSPVVVDIRPGALDDLAEILSDQRIAPSGRMAFAISGGSGHALRERFAPALPGADWFDDADGTIDGAKYAAARVGLPLVAVATNLANDGLCSPVATLDNDAGRGSYGVPNPIGVVIDLDVIRDAPVRYVRAGIGDVICKISAVADWELSHRETGEPVDGLAAAMARQAAEAVLRHPGGIGGDDFLTTLSEALVLCGLSMSVAGDSRPASGACHEICHAFDLLFPKRNALHGEQCGLGGAFATFLRGDTDMAVRMAGVLRRHGLPAKTEEIGFTVDEFVHVVEFAPTTRPGRFTILEHLNLSTPQIKDAYADYAKAIDS